MSERKPIENAQPMRLEGTVIPRPAASIEDEIGQRWSPWVSLTPDIGCQIFIRGNLTQVAHGDPEVAFFVLMRDAPRPRQGIEI